MKIRNLTNNYRLFFGQKELREKDWQSKKNETENQGKKEASKVTTMPATLMNATVPVNYTKVNEFTLPGTDINVHIYKLSNGQTVVLVPKKGETQINTYVNCGSMNEDESKRGISHFIEHNLFNGSKNIKPKELFNTINKMGAYTNAWTSEFGTSYMIKSHLFDSEDLKKIIELHSDMVQYPKFEQSELDKEKGVVNSEITMYDDDNSRILYGKAVKQLLNINTNSNDIVGGTVKNINNLSREDVVNYYNKNYTPDRMITVLTGEFNPNEAIELISKNFTKPAPSHQAQNHEKFTPIEATKRFDYVSPTIKNDEIALAFKGPENKDLKSIICTKIITDILCGSKHCELDKNLINYNIFPSSSVDKIGNKQNDPQVISLFANSNPNDTEKVIKTIFETVHNLKYKNLKEDIQIAKKGLLINIGNQFETGNSINIFLGTMLGSYSPSEIKAIPDVIKSITEDDIKNALNKYFDLNKVSIVVAHPKDLDPSDDPEPPGKIIKNPFKGNFKGKLEKKGLDLNEFKYTKLENNAKVFLKDDKSDTKHFVINITSTIPADINPLLPSVIEEIFSYGSMNSSIEDFSKDLAKHGTAIINKIDSSGITISAHSGKDDIDYALSKAIELLKNPKITQEALYKAKKQIAKEIKESQKSPSDYISNVMFPQLKSAATKEDKLNALNEITLGDISGFFEYLKKNSTLNFIWNKNEIPFKLSQLGHYKAEDNSSFSTYQPLGKDVLKVQSDNNGQAKIIQSFKYKYNKTPEETTKIAILNEILGGGQASRLFTDLRETQKLAYSTKSQTYTYKDTGIITLSIGTTTDNPQDTTAKSENVTKALNGFKKNIELIKNEPVSKEELEAAKLSLKASILGQLETGADKSFALIGNFVEHKDPDFCNKILKSIDKITPDDIQKTAQKVFEGHSLTSIVASEKTLKELNLLQQ